MSDEGILPDNAMLSSVAKALAHKDDNSVIGMTSSPPKAAITISNDNTNPVIPVTNASSAALQPLPNPADVWTFTDTQWRTIQRGTGSLYRRKMYGGTTITSIGGNGSYLGNNNHNSNNNSSHIRSPVPTINLGGSSYAAQTAQAQALAQTAVNKDAAADVGGLVGWFWGLNSATTAPNTPPPPTHSGAGAASGNTNNNIMSLDVLGLGNSLAELPFGTPPRPSRDSTATHALQNSQTKRISQSIQNFPDLEWKDFDNIDRKPVYVVSKKIRRHMVIAESLLLSNFPGLKIHIDNEIGMSCPGFTGKPCIVNRAQTLQEIYSGWEAGNPNKYTCKCFACGREFVPRFTVEYNKSVLSTGTTTTTATTAATADASVPMNDDDIESTSKIPTKSSNVEQVWCELLSPWTLRKEIFNIITQEGIEYLISPQFRSAVNSPQQAVLFWNAVIAFRLFGLPFSFLLINKSIAEAFPPKGK